ncbi:MAG: Holliday junction branch migration protein RuvA [Dehalococcoidia bacterium]
MIAALRGTVTRWDEVAATAWLEVQGVTYEVRIPAFAGEWIASTLGQEGTQVFTYYHVSERNPQPVLIGFQHLAERDFFRKFIEVPDVGPTKAVRALTYPIAEIARWIEAEDVKAVQQLPGIGQRLSQTIVAQLAGKLTAEALLRTTVEDGAAPPRDARADRDLREDAIEALVALQYSRRDAERAVAEALRSRGEPGDLEELLRVVLDQQSPA